MSINPVNQLSLFKLPFFKGNFVILELWFLFIQSIKLYNSIIFGVLNSPLIQSIIFLSPFTGETTKTQALSLDLYFINPKPINFCNFLANGSFFNPKVIQNLGLCFFFISFFGIQI
jgi:hypothetical protein